MEPCNFAETNKILGPPEGLTEDDVASMSVFFDPKVGYISCWKVNKEDLEEIQRTGRIWLQIASSIHPPVRLLGKKPWTNESV